MESAKNFYCSIKSSCILTNFLRLDAFPVYCGRQSSELYKANGLFGSWLISTGECIPNSASNTIYYIAVRNSLKGASLSNRVNYSLNKPFNFKSLKFSSTIFAFSRRNYNVTWPEESRKFFNTLCKIIFDCVFRYYRLI